MKKSAPTFQKKGEVEDVEGTDRQKMREDDGDERTKGPIVADKDSLTQAMQPPILAEKDSSVQEMQPPILAEEDSSVQPLQPCTLPCGPVLAGENSSDIAHNETKRKRDDDDEDDDEDERRTKGPIVADKDSPAQEMQPPILAAEDSPAQEMQPPILAEEDSSVQEMQPPILAEEASTAQEMQPPILSEKDSSVQPLQPCTLPSDQRMDQEMFMQKVHPARAQSCSLSELGTRPCTSSPLLELPSAELVDDDPIPLPCAQTLSTGGAGQPPSSPDTPCSRRSTPHPSPVPSFAGSSALSPVLAGENSSDIAHNETKRKRDDDDEDDDEDERRTKGPIVADKDSPAPAQEMQPPILAAEDSPAQEMQPPILAEEDSSVQPLQPPILAEEDSSVQEMQPPILAEEASIAQEMQPPILSEKDSSVQPLQPCTLPSDQRMDQEMFMQKVHPARAQSCSLSELGTRPCTSSPLLELPSAELVDDDPIPLPCAQTLSTGGAGQPPSSPDTPCSRRSTPHPSPVPSFAGSSALSPVLAGENSSDIAHNEGTERKRKRDDDDDDEDERRTKGPNLADKDSPPPCTLPSGESSLQYIYPPGTSPKDQYKDLYHITEGFQYLDLSKKLDSISIYLQNPLMFPEYVNLRNYQNVFPKHSIETRYGDSLKYLQGKKQYAWAVLPRDKDFQDLFFKLETPVKDTTCKKNGSKFDSANIKHSEELLIGAIIKELEESKAKHEELYIFSTYNPCLGRKGGHPPCMISLIILAINLGKQYKITTRIGFSEFFGPSGDLQNSIPSYAFCNYPIPQETPVNEMAKLKRKYDQELYNMLLQSRPSQAIIQKLGSEKIIFEFKTNVLQKSLRDKMYKSKTITPHEIKTYIEEKIQNNCKKIKTLDATFSELIDMGNRICSDFLGNDPHKLKDTFLKCWQDDVNKLFNQSYRKKMSTHINEQYVKFVVNNIKDIEHHPIIEYVPREAYRVEL
ncbi:uncharacterized protein LOC134066247 [Sardina pilchardus]|uniref:uncharacterized protein LOC134066247 n=1 Tax=Sardina pilchardus TaxID=27697 RepID=UPI002E0EA163